MKRGGESTGFRGSHWLTSLSVSCSKTFLVLSSFIVFQRLLAVRGRQAMVFWTTHVFQFCVQLGEGAAKPPHPLDSDTSLESSSKPHMTALNYWDLVWFWVPMLGCTTETLSFCLRLSNHWTGKEEDELHSVLSSALEGGGDAEACPCSVEQQLILMKWNRRPCLAWKEMTHSRAAMAFIWDVEKWWHNDVHLVIHNYLTASSPQAVHAVCFLWDWKSHPYPGKHLPLVLKVTYSKKNPK